MRADGGLAREGIADQRQRHRRRLIAKGDAADAVTRRFNVVIDEACSHRVHSDGDGASAANQLAIKDKRCADSISQRQCGKRI